MNFNWKVTHHGHDFFHWEMTCPAPMAEGQLSPPEKEKWVVKTGLGACEGRETFELSWCHLPKHVAGWFLQSSRCRRHFHGLREKANPAFWLRCRAVCLPLSCEWKKREEKKKKIKRHGSISWWWGSILFGIGCGVLPKMQQDGILSSREERPLIIIDSHPFDRREPGKWSINTG